MIKSNDVELLTYDVHAMVAGLTRLAERAEWLKSQKGGECLNELEMLRYSVREHFQLDGRVKELFSLMIEHRRLSDRIESDC